MLLDIRIDEGQIIMRFASGYCWGDGRLFDRIMFCGISGYY